MHPLSVPAGSTVASEHIPIEPSILYVGTPVALLSTENVDGSFNLAPCPLCGRSATQSFSV